MHFINSAPSNSKTEVTLSQVISFDDDHEIKATLTKNNVIKHSTSAASISGSGANSSFTSVSGANDVDKRELERKVQAALKNHNSYRSPSPSMSITYDDIVHLESNKGTYIHIFRLYISDKSIILVTDHTID